MIKKLLIIFIALIVGSCTISKSYQNSIALPEGTSLETARKIATSVWNDNYKEKIHNRFAHLTETQLNGLFINWRIFKPFRGDKKATVSIIVGIRYQGNLSEAEAIVEYGTSIIEEAINKYFKNRNLPTQLTNLFHRFAALKDGDFVWLYTISRDIPLTTVAKV